MTLLRAEKISKRFGGTLALDAVDFESMPVRSTC